MGELKVSVGADLGHEPVNLDGLGEDELVALENVYGRLAAYCGAKRQAQKYRLCGDIECALSYERCCENHHRLLPAWAKW